MKYRFVFFMAGVLLTSLLLLGYVFFLKTNRSLPTTQQDFNFIPTSLPTPTPLPKTLPSTYVLPQATQMFQTFNNCGPATLGMILSRYQIHLPQQQLADD